MKYFSVLLSVALFSAGVWAASPSADANGYERVTEKRLFNGDTLYEFRLPNKLSVLMVPRHQAKVLTYQTWFDVGSVNEKLDPKLHKTGLAHLFEHMMFRGSEKYPDGKFDELTARMGGDKQNATTYFYRTNYFESVPSTQLEHIMELESDRMSNLKLTSELLEKEKGAVVGELRRHLDSPGSMAFDELNREIFKVAPYRYTVLGSEEEIKGFSLSEAQYYYKTYYAPNNATLIVIGDVTEETLMPLVKKYYGAMAAQAVPHELIPTEPEQKKERRTVITHPQATSDILLIGYRIPPIQSPDTVPLSLLAAHLSSGTEARLHKILIDNGIAVGAAASQGNKPDVFEFSVQMAEGHRAEEALKIIDKEISSVQHRKIGKPAFERALNQELLNLYSDISDNSELGNWLGEYLMLSGDYMRGFQIIEDYKKINEADLMRVAKDYLRKADRSIVILRPAKAKEKSKS